MQRYHPYGGKILLIHFYQYRPEEVSAWLANQLTCSFFLAQSREKREIPLHEVRHSTYPMVKKKRSNGQTFTSEFPFQECEGEFSTKITKEISMYYKNCSFFFFFLCKFCSIPFSVFACINIERKNTKKTRGSLMTSKQL